MTLRQGKSLACKVILLDDQVPEFHITRKSLGEDLFSHVVKHLQLLEADYFGLEFKRKDQEYVWLDREKLVLYQTGTDHDLTFKFKVKFYTPDPNLLEDEFTRYLFALQIKQDLATGRLVCNLNTTAMLSAYIAQGELGDYNEEEWPDHTYLKCISFVPNQTEELEQCIMQYHRSMGGITPEDADFKLLDTARKTEGYGIVLHDAADHEDVALQLAVTDSGILIYQNKQKINTFSWAKIRKLSFKRKRFLIKLHPSSDQAYYKNIVEFYFPTRDRSKIFWKLAVEHHTFFRCQAVNLVRKHRRALLTRGSSFRYTGRTQKQLADHAKENYVKGSRSFDRALSTRHTLSAGHRSLTTSRSTTLNSKREFHDLSVVSVSSGSHVIGPSDSHHSGFKTPASPSRASPLVRSTDNNGLASPSLNSKSPPSYSAVTTTHERSMDRKMSEPVIMRNHIQQPDESRLSRAPDYTNIPEKVEENSDTLARTDSIKNIPKLVEQEKYAEPKVLQTATFSPAIVRVHSEADNLGTGKHPRDVSVNQTPDIAYEEPGYQNASQFLIGSSETMNGIKNSKTDTLTDNKKTKKHPTDKAYFIAKELLMTERTYSKDLSLVIDSLQNFVTVGDSVDETLFKLFEQIKPIYDNQKDFLELLEKRMGLCDSQIAEITNLDIGDILFQHFQDLKCYKNYLCGLEQMLFELISKCEADEQLSKKLQDFEMEKICYLPVFSLFVKPAHRLVYYELVLSKLLSHYSVNAHNDFSAIKGSLALVTELLGAMRSVIAELENTEKLIELQEDVGGVKDLVHQGRYFIREGCLQKLSRRGYQQRLFLLLSDVLLFTSRSQASSQPQFKVHGYMPLAGMTLEETEPNTGALNGFTIYGANRCLIVAANTQEEKDKWLEDLNFAISIANSDQIELADMPLPQVTPPSNGVQDGDENEIPSSPDKVPSSQHRANTTMHVCWHRNTSVSIKDIQNAIKHQLSGYLLRKFKNSNGWQKLWVVFTNFCLFFYKTYQDEFPLASLPLLGYSVSKPSASDGINKDFVFKLQFKNHVYFFRAESEYTYDRWMEVINSATHSARRTRLFSRIDSSA